MAEGRDYRKKLLFKYETKDSKPVSSKQTILSGQQTHRDIISKGSINSNAPSPATSKDMRDQAGQSRHFHTEQSVLSGSSSQTDLLKTDMVRRVFYQNKDLQSKCEQLKSDHQKLQQRYDRLLRVTKELKEKYDELKKGKKDRSDLMTLSEDNGVSGGASTPADSFQISQIPFLNTFLKSADQTRPANTPAPARSTRDLSFETKVEAVTKEKQRLEAQNLSLTEQLNSMKEQMMQQEAAHATEKSELELVIAELRERAQQAEEDYRAEKQKLQNIRMIVGLTHVP